MCGGLGDNRGGKDSSRMTGPVLTFCVMAVMAVVKSIQQKQTTY